MLVTKHFAFVHVPKTGGTFVHHLCREHLPREWWIDTELQQHSAYRALIRDVRRGLLPAEVEELPALCFVRNPWDWYVSWYHHEITPPEDQARWRFDAFDIASRDFKRMVTKACTEPVGDQVPLQVMRRDGVDLYSASHTMLAGYGLETGRMEVGRFENLREDLLDFLHRHQVPVDGSFEQAVRASAPLNVSQRRQYREYYDDELRDLVADRGRDLIARYRYSF
jgi:hypothetical protein